MVDKLLFYSFPLLALAILLAMAVILLVPVFRFFFCKEYLCSRCRNPYAKMTEYQYKLNGGVHEVCPPAETSISQSDTTLPESDRQEAKG